MVTSNPILVARIPDDNDFLRLKEMVHVHDDWNLEYNKNNLKIWSKSIPDATVKMFKVWSIFSAVSCTDLYNTLLDTPYRKEWDPHMIVTNDIGYLNPNNGISYYAVSCPPPLRSRDFVLQTSWLDRGTEQYIINHSVFHKDYPPKRGFIRAISYFTGFFIKCASVEGCEMSFISQTDPQGIIPSWIVNKCTQILAPRFIKQLEKAAFGYGQWKSQNNPDFIPWVHPEQMICPKMSISDCVPSLEEENSQFYKCLAEKKSKESHQNISENVKLGPSQAQLKPMSPTSSKTLSQSPPPSNTETSSISSKKQRVPKKN